MWDRKAAPRLCLAPASREETGQLVREEGDGMHWGTWVGWKCSHSSLPGGVPLEARTISEVGGAHSWVSPAHPTDEQ